MHKYFFYAIKLLIEFVKLTKGNIKVEITPVDYVQYPFKNKDVFKTFPIQVLKTSLFKKALLFTIMKLNFGFSMC